MAEQPSELRLFFAVRLEATPALRRVHRELAELPAVRAVDVEHLHVTLRFLGPTPAQRVGELSEVLTRAVGGEQAVSEVEWAGLGRFPASGRTLRVVYARPRDARRLEALAAELERELVALGEGPAERPFAAHLTLGRLRPRRGRRRGGGGGEAPAVDELLARYADEPLGVSAVRGVSLMASQLTPTGPVYEVVHDAR